MIERYFLLWNWKRFVFNVNLISFPITLYGITIQCQKNMVPESNWEILSLFFIFTGQSGTEEKISKKTFIRRDETITCFFWCNCIFKIILQPPMFKDRDSKPRIYNDLTYIAGKYDFPIPVAQILLYVFCY